MLKAQIEQAIRSQSKPIDVRYSPTEITLTIHDLDHDRTFADGVEKYFASRPAFSVLREPALTIRISYSEQALKAYRHDQLARGYSRLEDIVTGLRTLPPGVTVETDADGTILHAKDSVFADKLAKAPSLAVTPITKTSWRVTLSSYALAALGPADRIVLQRAMGGVIRDAYGDPADMREERTGDGIALLIPDPAGNQTFTRRVKEAFADDPNFVETKSQALVFHISEAAGAGNRPSSSKIEQAIPPIPAPESLMKAEIALEEIVNPTVELAVVGDAVSARAKNQADVDRVATLVSRALSDRTDLVVASQPDQSLLISLAPGAHIIPPRPPLQPGQLLSTIKARLNRLSLQAEEISSIDNDRARVRLATADDAATFRTALSGSPGLTIRMVDDANGNTAKPPSPGDERLQLPTKEYIWVRPRAVVTGDMIADAEPGVLEFSGTSIIAFGLTEEGRQRFAAATAENIGRRFAIIIDGAAVEAPVIQDAIMSGKGEIAGGFTAEQAAALAQSMRGHQNDLPLRVIDSVTQ